MDLAAKLTLISTVIIAVAGWLVGHWLTSRREILQKRREIRIEHLRRAYLNLAHVADSGGDLVSNIKLVQGSLNDIQLFGEPAQIELVEKFVTDLDRTGTASMDQLLIQLRNEIRNHLDLTEIEGVRWHVRISPPEEPDV